MTHTRVIERKSGRTLALHHLAGVGDQPLLISHATGFHGRCYTEMAEHLSERWSIWALDYSGHGLSPAPDAPLADWHPFADDVLSVAATIAPSGGLRVFGHSMGGAAVLLASLLEPTAFSRLVAFEPIAPPPTPGLDPDDLPIVKGAVRRRPGFESIEAAITNYSGKFPMSAFTPRCLDDYVRFGMEESTNGATLRCVPSFEASVFRGAHTNALWDRLGDIDLPTDVISGVVEDHQPSAFASAVADRLTHGRLHLHTEMDHFGPFVVPEHCARILDGLMAD